MTLCNRLRRAGFVFRVAGVAAGGTFQNLFGRQRHVDLVRLPRKLGPHL